MNAKESEDMKPENHYGKSKRLAELELYKWIKENKKGRKKFNKYRKLGQNHKIESVGNSLRKMMPWIEKNKIIR